jgi:thymidylate synthase (FAD)
MKRKVTILTGEPVVALISEMALVPAGIDEMVEWVRGHRPECLPDEEDVAEHGESNGWRNLFPHGCTDPKVTDNELLVELSGRKCYDSFGLKAGKKSNADYIANTQQGDVPHGSIMYHAKMSFFIAGISRRVSHELIRHYVGADRTEEGSPSQESTRFTHHYGSYIAHPWILQMEDQGARHTELEMFTGAMQDNYDAYLDYVERQFARYRAATGADPKGIDRKRIYESASPYLSHACETSFIWTTNPIALAKMFKERAHDAADLEYYRFASKWKKLCVEKWPNLFPQSWMRSA